MSCKIKREKPDDYKILAEYLYAVWDRSKGVYSDVFYEEKGLSIKRFLFDSLYQSKITIGDGVGVPGIITLYDTCNDDHIFSAMKLIWNEYHSDRPLNFTGK